MKRQRHRALQTPLDALPPAYVEYHRAPQSQHVFLWDAQAMRRALARRAAPAQLYDIDAPPTERMIFLPMVQPPPGSARSRRGSRYRSAHRAMAAIASFGAGALVGLATLL